jgi:hypothetical protein
MRKGVLVGIAIVALGYTCGVFGFWGSSAGASNGSADGEDAPSRGGPTAKAVGTSTVTLKRDRDGTLIPHTRNVRFSVQEIWNSGRRALLLREQIELEPLPARIGEGWATAKVDLTVNSILPDGTQKFRYHLTEFGQTAGGDQDFYVVTGYGCCSQGDGHAIFNLETGRRIMYTSGREKFGALKKISASDARVRGFQPRWVGVHTSGSVFDDAVYGPGAGRVAMVTYTNGEAPLTRVQLSFPPVGHGHLHMAVLEVKTSKSELGDASVHVDFQDAGAVEFPIHNDALDVAHAKLPRGVTAKIRQDSKP